TRRPRWRATPSRPRTRAFSISPCAHVPSAQVPSAQKSVVFLVRRARRADKALHTVSEFLKSDTESVPRPSGGCEAKTRPPIPCRALGARRRGGAPRRLLAARADRHPQPCPAGGALPLRAPHLGSLGALPQGPRSRGPLCPRAPWQGEQGTHGPASRGRGRS